MQKDSIQCPKCGGPCEADFVDIGVGEQQSGPYSCQECGWIEKRTEFGSESAAECWKGGDDSNCPYTH